MRIEAASVGREVEVLAARQRQDVSAIAQFLDSRECFVDFGSFPTEYTDLQFIALNSMTAGLVRSQKCNCEALSSGLQAVQASLDAEATALLTDVLAHEQDLLRALEELPKASAG